ncbi:hypothetical protein GCM10023213_28510 [Prosthecobacter algae]|uniref:Uncharacterized protein n=1 Tax=Prosthecobacter algae TaxID=1144682 RepID=A0ABP9PA86_9BACT
MSLFAPKVTFVWSSNEEGLAIRLGTSKLWKKAQLLKAPQDVQRGYRRMQTLAECGEAEIRVVDDGIFISTCDAVRLDESTRELFHLPMRWQGGMRLKTESTPSLPGFIARLGLVDALIDVVWNWRLRGPILEIGDTHYLPSAAQFAALAAFKQWQDCPIKDEIANLSLLASLTEAHEEGCLIDLETYREQGMKIVRADEIAVNATEDPATGDLILCPLPKGNFPEVTVDEMDQRLAQLDGESPRKVIRVGKCIILLDDQQTSVARAVKARLRVPRNAREEFVKNSALWLSDNIFPDVPIEFSPRVTGIGEWKGGYMGAVNGEPEDWFGAKPEHSKAKSDPISAEDETDIDYDSEAEDEPASPG